MRNFYYSCYRQYARHGISGLATVLWIAKQDSRRYDEVTICRGKGDSRFGGSYAQVDVIAYVTPTDIEFTHKATKREIEKLKGETL